MLVSGSLGKDSVLQDVYAFSLGLEHAAFRSHLLSVPAGSQDLVMPQTTRDASVVSYGFSSSLKGSDSDHVCDGEDEDLPVSYLACVRFFTDNFDAL